jgi:hypothetical protein
MQQNDYLKAAAAWDQEKRVGDSAIFTLGKRSWTGPASGEILDQDFIYPASTTMIRGQPGYNPNTGVLERESFLPGNVIQAQLPGAYRDDTYVVPGYSYQPDSYTPGSYTFPESCTGQDVTVYPEREQKVLFCGERNLQGNQTLKRTNIHHNYVHDINHQHNYHNRTRHAARQYNTVEKDCSCKGVATEASYKCPPGIEAESARAVAAQLLDNRVGNIETARVGTLTTTCPYAAQIAAAVGSTTTCDCSKKF